ncbi:hypothetical protein [Nocardia yamanashiensis]|uniref:hypothetical protein n=1 Tax=Nocardia yamanashiensis TaxID=209247 RepID=UPI000832101A|nr:hypothetical protein [Nocardia yamanashiensis]
MAAHGSAPADSPAGAASTTDLEVARTLLGAVLAATENSAVGLAWAVSVMRGPDGPVVFLTSNEGRGWLPAGIHLPSGISTPWQWDRTLGPRVTSAWEGVADPARVLAEFGRVWGPASESALTALVSSGPIDPSLQAALEGVATEGLVGPAYDLDLRIPTPGSVDRLDLFSPPLAEDPAAVADSMLRARCLELAMRAHMEVGAAVRTPAQAVAVRSMRERVLALAEAGQPIPRPLWDDLRAADEQLAADMLSHRIDTGRIAFGELPSVGEPEVLRALVFERRCTELALLLAGDLSRQTLRDALYAHQQIVSHPWYAEQPTGTMPARVSAPAAGVSAGAAGGLVAGPQSSVVAPVDSAPPAVTPGNR